MNKTDIKTSKKIKNNNPEAEQTFENNNNNLERYAVIETGGKQYFVLEEKTIAIEKLDANVGDEVAFEKVLLKKLSKDNLAIGQPYLNEPIKAIIIKHLKGPKLTVFKFKRRKKYRRKKGHRQTYTVVRILSFE
jgi:large subunit ribosomal protein L21